MCVHLLSTQCVNVHYMRFGCVCIYAMYCIWMRVCVLGTRTMVYAVSACIKIWTVWRWLLQFYYYFHITWYFVVCVYMWNCYNSVALFVICCCYFFVNTFEINLVAHLLPLFVAWAPAHTLSLYVMLMPYAVCKKLRIEARAIHTNFFSYCCHLFRLLTT